MRIVRNLMFFLVIILLQSNLAVAKQVLGFKLVEFKTDTKFDNQQIIIPSSEMWVFHPGIKVSIPNGGKFYVQGKIRIAGEDGSPVVFSSESGSWSGLVFVGDLKDERKKLVSEKIKPGMSFIRYARFENIGGLNTLSAPLFTLFNHEGIIVTQSSVVDSSNFSIAYLSGSEIYLDHFNIDGSLSYPVINSFNGLLQLNKVKFPSKPLIETAIALFNSASIITETEIVGERLIIDSDRSIVQLNNSRIRSQQTPIFQNQGIISLRNTNLENNKSGCPFNQSHDSIVLDYDAKWYCTEVWPSLVRHPDEEDNQYREQIEKMIKRKLYSKDKLIPFKKYYALRTKALSKALNWKVYSKNAKFTALEFIFFADNHFLNQWIGNNKLFRSNAKDINERYILFQRNVASTTIDSTEKVDSSINDLFALKRNFIGEHPTSGYCSFQQNKWYQNFSEYNLQLFPSKGTGAVKKASNLCIDFARDYFINFEKYHSKLIDVYRKLSPTNL